jgi:Zn-dependent protease/CBS domain-containing protein
MTNLGDGQMDRQPVAESDGVGPPHGAREAGGFRLGKLLGVEVTLDWSLLIIFFLVVLNLGAGLFPRWHPDWSPLELWGTALGAAVLFFASILAHELSHAVVARAQGIPVNRITLFLFGGMAHLEQEPASPKAEFAMAIVGPITSVLIGVAGILAGSALSGESLRSAMELGDPAALEAAFQTMGPVATLLLWLGPINVLLGVFNVIPGFPLDGGRVLRSALWAATGDLVKATRWASGAGQVVAWGLIVLGIFDMFGGAFASGLWLVLIGWFLNQAARMSYQQLIQRRALENVPVARVMRTRLDRVAANLPLESFVRDHLMLTDQRAFPVESPDGTLMGLVCFNDLKKVPQQDWPHKTVADVMTPTERLSALPPEAAADQALQSLATRGFDQLPVLEGRHLVGIVRRADLMKWLALQGGGAGRSATSPG